MKKLSLSTRELVQLSTELLGNENVKGLLSLKTNFLAKYKLNRLYKTLNEELKAYYETSDELIKEYGEKKDSEFFIPYMISEEIDGKSKFIENPKYVKYREELEPVLDQEREIELIEISIDELKDVNIELNCHVFFDKILIN